MWPLSKTNVLQTIRKWRFSTVQCFRSIRPISLYRNVDENHTCIVWFRSSDDSCKFNWTKKSVDRGRSISSAQLSVKSTTKLNFLGKSICFHRENVEAFVIQSLYSTVSSDDFTMKPKGTCWRIDRTRGHMQKSQSCNTYAVILCWTIFLNIRIRFTRAFEFYSESNSVLRCHRVIARSEEMSVLCHFPRPRKL